MTNTCGFNRYSTILEIHFDEKNTWINIWITFNEFFDHAPLYHCRQNERNRNITVVCNYPQFLAESGYIVSSNNGSEFDKDSAEIGWDRNVQHLMWIFVLIVGNIYYA